MNRINLRFLSITLLVFLLCGVSCKKEVEPPISQQGIWDCHHERVWDSTGVKNALLGKWELKYGGLYYSIEDETPKGQNARTVEFIDDSISVYNQDGIHIGTSTWKVVDGDSRLFELEVKPGIVGLYGRILICDDWVEFNISYLLNGGDTYFRRIE